MDDRRILYAATLLRSLATGMAGVLLGIYLARLDLSSAQIGFVVAAGLAGGAAATLAVTLAGDRLGRRRALIVLSWIGAAGAAVVALGSEWRLLASAAFLGMLNGMGRDRGASLVVEQAILPAMTEGADRTRAFAWYNVLQGIGHAAGALLAGLPGLLRPLDRIGDVMALRLMIGLYAVLILSTGFLYLRLSRAVEAAGVSLTVRVSEKSRRLLWKISSLFALDSLAGGFLTTALLSFFFFERFGVGEGVIGLLFFGARVANTFSHLGAAWLADRIGLVNTMVFTHVPSSLLLVTVAFAPSFSVAAALFLLREGLVEMDVPTRQSYVMAVVRPEERTFASGVTHLVRLGAWAVAPFFAGLLMQRYSLMAPLLIGAAMKITYDLLLYLAFSKTKAPEEAASVEAAGRME